MVFTKGEADSSLNIKPLKFVEHIIYGGSNISSTESNVNVDKA